MKKRKTNLLLAQAGLPNASGKPFDWSEIVLAKGLNQEYLTGRKIHGETRESHFLWWGWDWENIFISTLIGLMPYISMASR